MNINIPEGVSRSEDIKDLCTAIMAFREEIGTIKKDALNPHYSHKFASLPHILDKADPLLNKHQLCYLQIPIGKTLFSNLTHLPSGQYIEGAFEIQPSTNSPHAMGSAITYGRRYALTCLLGLKIEGDDDDGNNASLQPKANKQQQGQQGTSQQAIPQGGSTAATPATPLGNTVAKPWMPDTMLTEAVNRIMAGEENVIEKLKTLYNINKANLGTLEAALLIASRNIKIGPAASPAVTPV